MFQQDVCRTWIDWYRMHKILFSIGISLCLIPFCLQTINQYKMNAKIESMQETIHEENASQKIFQDAREYNAQLSTRTDYEQQLNPLHNGYMATIQIDKIHVRLPIYHYSDEDILSEGIGHIPWSSLPVGGKNIYAILTGLSGCASYSFFNRLDDL